MNKLIGLIAFLLIGIQVCFAQTKKVSGSVTDKSDRSPLPGVSVLIKGTATGVATDISGSYSIQCNENDVLIFSFVGMQSQEIAVSGKSQIDVEMSLESASIEEVVVTGYGSFKKSSFTGSASTMNTDKLQDVPTISLEDKLAGSVAGVQMNAKSGQPGAAVDIKIRGIGSMNAGSDPLFVIDGVPVTSGNVAEFSYSGAGSNLLASLNSNDIESITVIKDAAAASLYGSRAANGVIVINTKKGSSGKTNFNFKGDWGFSNVAVDYRPTLGGEARRELLHYGLVNYAKGDGMSETEAAAYADSKIDNFAAKPWSGWTDWNDLLFRTGKHESYEVNASGGNNKTTFYTSLSYSNTEGVTDKSALERYTGTANISHKADRVLIEASTSFSRMLQDAVNERTSYSNPYMLASWTASPSTYPYEEDGSMSTGFPLTNGSNPLAWLKYNYNKTNTNRSFNKIAATLDIWDNLKLKELISYDYVASTQSVLWDKRTNDGSDYNGLFMSIGVDRNRLNTQTQLTYDKTLFESHNIDVLLGFETEDYQYKYIYADGYDYPGYLYEITNAAETSSETYNEQSKMVSYLGRLNYNYDNKYYFGASFRRDGTSRLSSDNRWGNFWSLSASWRIMSENFMASLNELITDAKLRVSYGVNGTLPSSYYSYMSLYKYGYLYNGMSGMAEGSAGNSNLKWEKNNAFNIGLDVTIKERFSFTLDWYTRASSDLLMDKAISFVPGMVDSDANPSVIQNVGKLKNSGIELEIRTTNIQTKDLVWTTAFNITHNKNELVKLDGSQTEIFDVDHKSIIHREGEVYNSFWAYESAGVDPTTGKEMFYINDGTENARKTTTEVSEANRKIIGNADPKVQGGLTNFVKWKFIDFNMTLTYQLGGHAMDYATWLHQDGGTYNYYGSVPSYYKISDMWQKEGDHAKLPQFVYGNTGVFSSRWMMSTDYLRVKNLTLGFSAPEKWINQLGLTKARAYFSANNLLTWKAEDMLVDPETPAHGMCTFEAPALRTFAFGVEIGF